MINTTKKQLETTHFEVEKLENVVSAVGAGDSFSGGFISGLYSMIDQKDQAKALRYAIEIGTK